MLYDAAAVYIKLKCVHEIASFPGPRLFRLHEEHFTFVQSNKPGTWERGYTVEPLYCGHLGT